jgi:hypothetical protein
MIRSLATAFGISLAVSLILAVSATANDGAAAATDSGTVIFYRPSAFKGKAIRFNINHFGKPVGQLLSGTKIELPVPAGEHVFTTSAPSLDGQDSVTITVEAGQKHYIKGDVRLGWPAGRPKFTVMSETAAQSELAQLN